jgi:hypothetical protein
MVATPAMVYYDNYVITRNGVAFYRGKFVVARVELLPSGRKWAGRISIENARATYFEYTEPFYQPFRSGTNFYVRGQVVARVEHPGFNRLGKVIIYHSESKLPDWSKILGTKKKKKT